QCHLSHHSLPSIAGDLLGSSSRIAAVECLPALSALGVLPGTAVSRHSAGGTDSPLGALAGTSHQQPRLHLRPSALLSLRGPSLGYPALRRHLCHRPLLRSDVSPFRKPLATGGLSRHRKHVYRRYALTAAIAYLISTTSSPTLG